MRDLAGTVTDAPPLRLTADATGLAPALPGYYVALRPVSGRAGAPDGLVVGDTRTGKTVAVIAPPAGTTFTSVSGAADDRTFAVIAGPISGNSFFDSFYLLTIAPGSSPATRLTRLPVGPLTGVVVAAALSASGKELAVAMGGGFFPGGANRDLVVYSVTTGDAVEDWSTPDTTVIVPSSVVPDDNLLQFTQYPALSWIDGDRAIAFPQLAKTGRSTRSTCAASASRRAAVTSWRTARSSRTSAAHRKAPAPAAPPSRCSAETGPLPSASRPTDRTGTRTPPPSAGCLSGGPCKRRWPTARNGDHSRTPR
jgi:hypothetical protein